MMSTKFPGIASLGFILPVLLLSGCSADFGPSPVSSVETSFGSIGGVVHGGQQPIVLATVQALQTSTTAYGGASTVLASSTTDANGGFTFPASTTCTSGAVVYLYSLGGQPTTGVTNSAAGLMAVLGTCPANGKLVNAVVAPPATSAYIYMNEVSTVAAAYSLAGFAITSANSPTDATHIGALTTSNTLAQTGIQNAAATAAQMYTAIASSGGPVGGTYRSALATTPGGNGKVPQQLIDTIANILAACINSGSSGSSKCTTLFNDARSGGGQTGTQATDTATAAIYLAQHPASAYVTTLFNLVGSTADPFTPALSSAPATFIVELEFNGGGLGIQELFWPQNVAIDASGNVWVTNTTSSASSVSKFSPLGVSLAGANGFTASSCGLVGLNGNNPPAAFPTTIAIATNGNAWVGVTKGTGVCVLNSSGAYVAYTGLDANDSQNDGLGGIALDASGNAFVTDDSTLIASGAVGGTVVKLNGTNFTVSQTLTGNGLNYPFGIAIDAPSSFAGHTGDIWVGNFNNKNNAGNNLDSVFLPSGAAAPFSPTAGGSSSIIYGAGIAIDSGANIWTVDSNSPGGVSKTASSGTTGSYFPQASANVPVSVSIDGAGNVWYTSDSLGNAAPFTNTILEVNNAGALLSPSAGYVPIHDTNNDNEPQGVSVDGSGNVWYVTSGISSGTVYPLREIVGAAVPVATPIAYGVANNKLGTRP